jgi:hypothetical protein
MKRKRVYFGLTSFTRENHMAIHLSTNDMSLSNPKKFDWIVVELGAKI